MAVCTYDRQIGTPTTYCSEDFFSFYLIMQAPPLSRFPLVAMDNNTAGDSKLKDY